MDLLDLKLILLSGREVLADAVRALIHLALGEDSDLLVFPNYQEALTAAPWESLDIVLLEADSEVLAQIDALKQSKYQGSIVVLTQSPDHDLGFACIRAGAQDYLNLEELSPSSLFRSLRFTIERSQAQRALENSRRQLSQAQKMEAIGRMASGLAHDFRQYIQIISGNSSVLQKLCPSDEEIGRLINEIAQAGFGANELVSQVLDFAREGPGDQRSLDFNKVVLSNRAMIESFGKKVGVTFAPSSEELKVLGDAVQIGQITLNLAINAVDACGEEGSIEIRTRRLRLKRRYSDSSLTLQPGSYVILEVRDTGTGVPEEVRAKLFDPFFTTKARGKGTGLGLSTVFALARGMSGLACFWTRLGQGTSFSVILPSEDDFLPLPRRSFQSSVGVFVRDPSLKSMVKQDISVLRARVRELDTLEEAKAWEAGNPDSLMIVSDGEMEHISAFSRPPLLLSALSLPTLELSPSHRLGLPYSLGQLSESLSELEREGGN